VDVFVAGERKKERKKKERKKEKEKTQFLHYMFCIHRVPSLTIPIPVSRSLHEKSRGHLAILKILWIRVYCLT
jgi:hypothetical protein